MTPGSAVRQMDLLDWAPPAATVEFNPADVRGATIAARLSRAISQTLRDSEAKRSDIAARMTRFLGGPEVTKAMVDVYAAPSRPDQNISVPRFLALIHATGDRRLLQMLADEMGWAVIERRHLPLIEVAELREQEDRIKSRRMAALARAGRR